MLSNLDRSKVLAKFLSCVINLFTAKKLNTEIINILKQAIVI